MQEVDTTVLSAFAETIKPKWAECPEECDFSTQRELPNVVTTEDDFPICRFLYLKIHPFRKHVKRKCVRGYK